MENLSESIKDNNTNTSLIEVICPNKCHSGFVKHFPDSEKALYVMVKCQICKGRGIIHESQKSRIEAMI